MAAVTKQIPNQRTAHETHVKTRWTGVRTEHWKLVGGVWGKCLEIHAVFLM